MEAGEYRQNDDDKKVIQRIADDRAAWTEQVDRAFQKVPEALDERFGFDRGRGHDRDRDR